MKKKYLLGIVAAALVAVTILLTNKQTNKPDVPADIQALRAKHAEFLKNSPFRETQHLTKKDRKNRGLPPNPYYERMWELSMNPALGRPTWENINRLQEERYARLNDPRALREQRVPGDAADNSWVERGPNNIGGRTRVVVFDPNDATNRRVFAGGVSGGLWVNQDITSAASVWQRITSVPGHLNVSAFAVDPNNPQIMYLGTGEQYTFGAAVGNGVYKSTNGGNSWVRLNVQLSANDPGNLSGTNLDVFSGIFYVNDIVVRNNGGNSEVYVGIGSHFFAASRISNASNPDQLTGSQSAGLYRSTDDGANWTRNESANLSFSALSGRTFFFTPNDFEIGADNKLWMGMIDTPGFGGGGGKIFNSTDGLNWTEVVDLANTDRVEIALSATDPNRVYALAEGTTAAAPVRIFSSTNGTTFTAAATLPDDIDTGIPANDFTRGQAFYDLVIEADPNNHNLVYVGGIDLFSGVFNGVNNFTWTQISKWSNSPGLGTLNVPLVHADQHGFTFRPGNSNQAVLGHDGGVSFAVDLAAAALQTDATSTTIQDRNNGYAVTQFYYGDIARLTNPAADDIVGGTQDNGTQFSRASASGINPFVIELGGDGAFTEIDKDGDYMITSFPGASHVYLEWPVNLNSIGYLIVDKGNNGSFINTAALDENLDILYSDLSTGATNQIGRYSNLKNGQSNVVESFLTGGDGVTLDASITAMKVSPFTAANRTNLYVGLANSRLIKIVRAESSIALAQTWTDITGPGFIGSISDIEFGQSESEIFVTMHNFGVPSLWYTTDGGATWQNKEGNLPDIPVRAVLQNPHNTDEVILGTMLGVWRTDNFNDASPSWSQSQNGMSDVSVVDLDLIADAGSSPTTSTVLATTHGRGMFTGTFNEFRLSLEDNLLANNQLKIFPTLASTEINLIANSNLGEADVKIYNLSGQQMLSQKIDLNFGNSNRVLLNGFSNGVYILSVKGEGISKTQKFVVRK